MDADRRTTTSSSRPGTPLAAGDIVEVLSNVIDLGDDALATVAPAASPPPRRAVGQLAQLAAVEVAAAADEVVFRLSPRRPGLPRRARRPLRRPRRTRSSSCAAGTGSSTALAGGESLARSAVLEDGDQRRAVEHRLLPPGHWWQYEARVGTETPTARGGRSRTARSGGSRRSPCSSSWARASRCGCWPGSTSVLAPVRSGRRRHRLRRRPRRHRERHGPGGDRGAVRTTAPHRYLHDHGDAGRRPRRSCRGAARRRRRAVLRGG